MLINVNPKDEAVTQKCDEIYNRLSQKFEVLYDDEDLSFGQKLSRAEMLGIRGIMLVSKKTLEQDCVEVRSRASGEVEMVKIAAL